MIDSYLLIIQPNTKILEALDLMVQSTKISSEMTQNSSFSLPRTYRRSTYALVVEAEELLGIITERDIVRLTAQRFDLANITAVDVMTRQLITIQETELANPFTALNIFRQNRIRHIPVLNDQQHLVGVITQSSVRKSLKSSDLLRIRQVKEVMSCNVVTALAHATVIDLAELMASRRVSCVVIIKEPTSTKVSEFTPIGLVTERDIVQCQTLGLNLANLKAQVVMSSPLVFIEPEENLWQVNQTMDQIHVRWLVVKDDQNLLIGIVTQSSILSVLDPIEMQNTIAVLQQELEQLRNEQTRLLLDKNLLLEGKVIKTEEQFQAIFNQTFQFIGFLNPKGILLEVNQTALNFAGLNRENVINRPFWEAYWGKISSASQQQLRNAIAQAAQGEFVRYEVEVQGVGGKIITIDFSICPILDETGKVRWLIVEGRNISRLKSAQEELWLSQQHYAKLTEAAPVGIFQTDVSGDCCYVNEEWSQISGISAKDALGKGWLSGLHSEDRENVAAEWYRSAQANELFSLEYRFQSPSGLVTWVLGQAVAETDSNNQINGYIGTIYNITERKQAELKLAQHKFNLEIIVAQRTSDLESSRQRHARMYQKTPVMLHSIDAEGCIRHVSDYWLEKLGYRREEVIGHKSTEFLTPASRHYAETVVLPEYFKNGFCFEIPYQILTKEGQVIDILLSANRNHDNTGQEMSLAVMVDVTASNQELYREKELAQVTLQSIADAVITTDAQGLVEFVNPIAEELTGWKSSEAKGLPLTRVFHIINEITRIPAENPIDKVLLRGQICGLANHTALISKNGIEYSIEDSAAPIFNRVREIIGAVMVFHDVTQSRQLQKELSWQASHDSLTGLVNRQRFEQELDEAFHSLSEDNQVHILCYLDLDQFKIVNDTCGHDAGDQLLRQISQLLKKQIRSGDTLARLGGDEFGILLKQCTLKAARAIAEKMREAVQDFRFIWHDKVFSIGVSIGVTSINTDSILTEVLSLADSACYAAKNKGRNRIQVYENNDLELIDQRGEWQWSLLIKQALAENRFCLYRQAIASITQPHNTAYEVLLRMIDDQGNLILPDRFIPAAERYNLMPHIDRWVIRNFLNYFEQTLTNDVSMSDIDSNTIHFINLSGTSIGDNLFLKFIKEEFQKHNFSPQNIGFEITETAAISNLQQATYFIGELKQLGCQFSLDDFGSGMSSFGYLKNLPVDYLKIDGFFVRDILTDPATYAIVESINHVGHVMGLKTIAEYVENFSLRECLDDMGIDFVQGFGIALPAPISMNKGEKR